MLSPAFTREISGLTVVIIAIVAAMKWITHEYFRYVDDKLTSLSTIGAIFLIEEGIRVASCPEMTASSYVGKKNSCRMLFFFPYFLVYFRNIQERVLCSYLVQQLHNFHKERVTGSG